MTDLRRWPLPAQDEIHIWWIDLTAEPDVSESVLCPDERARAARFHCQIDRDRWIRARVALRGILAGYLGISPKDVRFTLDDGAEGERVAGHKPALASDPRLRFSLAHAADRAALAIAWEREVGIDLEPVDADLDLPPLLRIACSPAEAARIGAAPPSERVARFLELWTAKEAYLKAIGLGLSREPRALEAAFEAGGRAVIHDAHDPAATNCWTIRLLDAGPGWTAALAVEGAEMKAHTSAWPPSPNALS